MNPNLRYAQAIHGVTTGRGTGIIDTIHLVEVARAIEVLQRGGALPDARVPADSRVVRGLRALDDDASERHRGARREEQPRHLLGDAGGGVRATDRRSPSRSRCAARASRRSCCPTQMAADGSFPQELARTKPYGYSLFNLDAMATICQILSTPADNLWTFELPTAAACAARSRSWRRSSRQAAGGRIRPTCSTTTSGRCAIRACCSPASRSTSPDYVALWSDAEGRLDRRRGRAQLLHPAAAALARVPAASLWSRRLAYAAHLGDGS